MKISCSTAGRLPMCVTITTNPPIKVQTDLERREFFGGAAERFHAAHGDEPGQYAEHDADRRGESD